MSGLRHSDRIEQAAQWFAARRRGVMALDERESYEAWLRDAANAAAMTELERVWQAVGIAGPDLVAVTREPARKGFVRPALVAAMCAVSIGIAVLSYSGNPGFWTTLDWTDR